MFTHHEEAGRLVVHIDGNLDEDSSATLHEYLRGLIDSGHRCLVLDCGNVGYICSSGLAVLCSVRSKLRDEGAGWIKLAALNQDIKDVLSFVMIGDMIDIQDTVAEALVGD